MVHASASRLNAGLGGAAHEERSFIMRRVLRFPVIVAVGVGVLMLGALLGSGTWANVFLTEPGELACLSVTTPTGKTASCSTVEETTLLQRLTKDYTYYAPGHRDSTGMSVAGSTTLVAQAAAQQPARPMRGTSLAQAYRVSEEQTSGTPRKAGMGHACSLYVVVMQQALYE